MNQQPTELLRMAECHIANLPDDITGLPDSDIETAIDHGIQAIILAAACVESSVNVNMALPLCLVNSVAIRAYFADVLKLASRTSIREKISFLVRNRDSLEFSKEEKEAIKNVFDARNNIMHSTPAYSEVPVTDLNTRGLPDERIKNLTGPTFAVFKTSERSSNILNQAREACKAARNFLDKMSKSQIRRYPPPTTSSEAAFEDASTDDLKK